MRMRTIRRTVPSPMYMRLPPFVVDCFYPEGLTHKPGHAVRKAGRNEARSPSRGRESTILPASCIRGSRSRGPVGGACPARRRPQADPTGRPDGLGRTTYCASAGSLRRFQREPRVPFLRDRSADPRRDRAPQVDLVELLGLPQARPRAQGLRLLQVGHVSLTTTRTRWTPLLQKPS